MSALPRVPPVRLFLDAGVIIEGCAMPWGASKAVLIHAIQRRRFTVVLAAAIEQEVQRTVARRAQDTQLAAGIAGWLSRVRLERCPLPSHEEIMRQAPGLLPVIRHQNDLAAVISALEAQPDWVISTNIAHWGEALAARTGLRVRTPQAFLEHLAQAATIRQP